MASLGERPLREIAAALREGRVPAVALADAAAAAYRAFDGRLDAYQTWAGDAARRQAGAADAALVAGTDLGPLHGIPVSVKDIYGVAGLPTYAGTPKRLPAAWEREGPLVRTLRRQLAPITGKTHTVEFAFGGLGVNNHWGTPRNPWDPAIHRVPGGSSSGAAVSLCEGSARLALGTDTAGSVRIPASMTGTVGLKTTAGRWPVDGIVPLSTTLDTAGVLARSVADVAYAFEALDAALAFGAGREEGVAPADAARVRVGFGERSLWDGCEPGIVEAVQGALDELGARGVALEERALPEATEAIALLQVGSVAAAECDAFLAAELPQWRAILDPVVTARIADGGSIAAREYLQRLWRLRELAGAARVRFGDCDVLAAPTVPLSPPALADVSRLEDYRPRNMAALRNTCVANFLGLCALSMPAGVDSAGMPVGLQLLARGGDERRLLAVALALERLLGSPRERLGSPPLCAD